MIMKKTEKSEDRSWLNMNIAGVLITLITQCCQKYKKNLPPEVAADHLEQKVEDIKRIYAAIEATNTQDADEIYKYLFGDADR